MTGRPRQASPTLPNAGRLRSDVVRFAAMGDHRTGSEVDLATATWIRERLAKAGFDARLDPWPLRQFHFRACWIELYGRRLEAFPLWHPTPIGAEPTEAVVAFDPEPGQIGLVQFDDVMVTPRSDHKAKIDAMAALGAKAVIGCTPHPSGDIYGQNVIPPYNQVPWPIPVLLTKPSDWHVLADVAEHGGSVLACLLGDVAEATYANNVVARRDRGDRWIIVSTPQSGWFRCAGERGAGVALLLALAEWVESADMPHSFLFLSNSGHEIGHMGIKHLLGQETLPVPGDTDCWLHLGASIGTMAFEPDNKGLLKPSGPDPDGWLFGSDDMMESLESAFAEFDHLKPELYNRKSGEIRWILESGYTAFSLMGPQRFFHLAADGPENVDEFMLAKLGRAVTRTLHSFASKAG